MDLTEHTISLSRDEAKERKKLIDWVGENKSEVLEFLIEYYGKIHSLK